MNLLKSEPQPLPLLSISVEAEEYRNRLALSARAINAVVSPQTNLQARNVAVEIRMHLKEIETERVRLTGPFLRAQRALKSLADDYTGPLEFELARLERLATDYLEAKQRRVERQTAKQDVELTGLMQERLALEAQAAQAASECSNDTELAEALAIEARAKAASLAVQSAVAAPLPAVDKVRGQSIRQKLCWEVMDIAALWKAKPDCVKLVPCAAMIQELCVPEMPTPGLKCWWENRATYSTRQHDYEPQPQPAQTDVGH